MKRLTKRQKQAIATKFKILEIAFGLFKSKGYDSVKVQDICDAAEISVGAFYHHFSSKLEIINTGYEQVDTLLIERYESKSHDDYRQMIIDLMGEGGNLLEELGWPFVSEVYKNLITLDNKYTLSETRPVYIELKKALTCAMDVGAIEQTQSPDALATTIMRLSRGAIFDWCLNKGTYKLKDRILEDIHLVISIL